MNVITAKNFSLLCTTVNIVAAISSFSSGQYLLGILCTGLAGICARNFWMAK
jgi:hypothetical protein